MLEAPILGVPSLDIGTRQKGRYSPPTVSHVEEYDSAAIAARIEKILLNRPAESEHPYGAGDTSQRIHATLARVAAEKSRKAILQKRITY
jgi:UDP-N-acetylglucosamine 2-epimerase